jgi:hypothetical protein
MRVVHRVPLRYRNKHTMHQARRQYRARNPALPAPEWSRARISCVSAAGDSSFRTRGAAREGQAGLRDLLREVPHEGGAKATAAKLKHFDMTSYPFAGHHAAEWGPKIRQQLGIGGGKAKMPKDKPGSVRGDDLALIEAWSRAWDAAQAAGAHAPAPEHHHHHH